MVRERAVGRARLVAGVQVPPRRACPDSRDRSRPDSDTGPELHKQLVDGGAACGGGLPQVGAPLDDLAPDGARHLCLLCLTTRLLPLGLTTRLLPLGLTTRLLPLGLT